MVVIDKIEKFIFEAKTYQLIFVIMMLTLFKTGIWFIPNLGATQAIAQNPFVNPFSDPNAHYLFWSWLGPFVAWVIGAKSKCMFFAFHLFFSLAFTLLYIRVVFVNFSKDVARSSIVFFSMLPVSATSYFWVGPDSITLFLMLSALAFPSTLILTFLIGVLLGMQHFEQGFFATAGLLFAVVLSHKQHYNLKYSVKFCLLLFFGVIAGKLILIEIFKSFSIEVNSGRMHWLKEYLPLLLNQFFFHFHYIIWSVLGLGWVIVLKFADFGKKSVPFFVSLAGLCLLLPVSGDQTRVVAIITFPLISVYCLLNSDFLNSLNKKQVSLIFLIWSLMPWGWVWGGTPKWSVFPYDIAYALHRIVGWFNVPVDPAVWPF